MKITLLDSRDATWGATVDRVYESLGFPDNPLLFPPHFTQVVLPKLGGGMALLHDERDEQGVGFLFPRAAPQGEQQDVPAFTLRFHALADDAFDTLERVLPALRSQLDGADVVIYDPQGDHVYAPTHEHLGALDIGRPSRAETESIRRNHQTIWGSPPEFLYPTDIHSRDFWLGASLVARVDASDPDARVAGFLFGFYKWGGAPLPSDWHARFGGHWRLESQAMGVLPAQRGKHIGYLLKWKQAELARQDGIGIVNWTVDPLQFPNAALNFGLLRAMAFDHYADLYPFRNELNQVPASRFGITWLVDTARVRSLPVTGASADVVDLAEHPALQRVNRGWQHFDTPTADQFAIEIPADWTALQREKPDQAAEWRATTDRFFGQHIGRAATQYVITGVGAEDERRYLLAQRAGDALWARLAA